MATFFRTLRAFFVRKAVGFTSRLRRLTNFSRHATKAASSSLQGVVSAAQKPTGPDDYVETGRLYIAKSLIIKIILTLIALGLIIYFLVWPFILSHFLTAKFYVQDKRVEDWSGKVIVFSDKKKKLPMYAGRLEDGVLQGEGKLYDEDCLVCYQGQFRDGIRSGNGEEYLGGVLVYEGQFADGLYEGKGRLYESGQLAYEGQFASGKPSGSGTAYKNGTRLYDGFFLDGLYDGRGRLYQDGVLAYEGDFQSGTANGTGTSYYPTGRTSYQGQFLSGVRDGVGTEYAPDGRKVYSGGFAEGVYNGEGTKFYTDGSSITASFKDGEPEGSVQWRKNGILYYSGEWKTDAPEGFGVLYNKAGKKIFEGYFTGGSVDGLKMLEYSVDEFRSALGDGIVRTEETSEDFRIVGAESGVTALCTFRTEDSEPAIYKVYLAQSSIPEWVSILPGAAHTDELQWPDWLNPEDCAIYYFHQLGVERAQGLYAAKDSTEEGRRVTALYSSEERKQTLLIAWSKPEITPQALRLGEMSIADGRLEGFLGALDLMDGTSGTAVSSGAEFGAKPLKDAFAKCADYAQAGSLIDAMLNCWEQNERKTALEENLGRIGVLLEDARAAAARGDASLEAIKTLEEQQKSLTAQIDACKTAIKRAELKAQELGVSGLSEYALGDVLASFDPSTQDVEQLSLIAAAYAQATGSGTGDEEADSQRIDAIVKSELLDLADARSAVEIELSRYQTAAQAMQNAAGAYARGEGSKESWYAAMNEQAYARASLSAALAAFTREANTFNQLTGGWVSRMFDWLNPSLEPLFQAAILPEPPESEKTEEAEETEGSKETGETGETGEGEDGEGETEPDKAGQESGEP